MVARTVWSAVTGSPSLTGNSDDCCLRLRRRRLAGSRSSCSRPTTWKRSCKLSGFNLFRRARVRGAGVVRGRGFSLAAVGGAEAEELRGDARQAVAANAPSSAPIRAPADGDGPKNRRVRILPRPLIIIGRVSLTPGKKIPACVALSYAVRYKIVHCTNGRPGRSRVVPAADFARLANKFMASRTISPVTAPPRRSARRWQKSDAQGRRELIVEIALRLLHRQGCRAVDDAAGGGELGLGTMTLYTYVEGQQGLYRRW